MTASAIYLFLTICFDGNACQDKQVFKQDVFTGPAAYDDCVGRLRAQSELYSREALPTWRLRCTTLEQIEKDGL